MADNVPGGTDAITSLGWEFPPTHGLMIHNSILGNGGNEVFTTHPSTTTVASSNVQGGWVGAGAGNVDADPLFAAPGGWSFEGEWIDEDGISEGYYYLKVLQADGNTAWASPVWV